MSAGHKIPLFHHPLILMVQFGHRIIDICYITYKLGWTLYEFLRHAGLHHRRVAGSCSAAIFGQSPASRQIIIPYVFRLSAVRDMGISCQTAPIFAVIQQPSQTAFTSFLIAGANRRA
tara:strand:- start:7394 stop:7747 length:354 start_codon:yes stop_codon:yes gene_type:complete